MCARCPVNARHRTERSRNQLSPKSSQSILSGNQLSRIQVGVGRAAPRAAAMNAATLAGSFRRALLSTPLATSTPFGARRRDGGRDVLGRQPARQQERPPRMRRDQRPRRRHAAAAEALDVRVVEPERRRPARRAFERSLVPHAQDADQLADRGHRSARATRRRAAARDPAPARRCGARPRRPARRRTRRPSARSPERRPARRARPPARRSASTPARG